MSSTTPSLFLFGREKSLKSIRPIDLAAHDLFLMKLKELYYQNFLKVGEIPCPSSTL